MSRDFFINGEVLVQVKGRSDSAIGTLTQLCLTDRQGAVRIRPIFKQKNLDCDPWGDATVDVQIMLAEMEVTMNGVHIDRTVLDTVIQESMALGNVVAAGQFPRAGTRMGNNLPRFSPSGTVNPANGLATTGNHWIGLNLTSPQAAKPWRFFYSMLSDHPLDTTVGVERSPFNMTWKVIPYVQDPWNNGQGALGYNLWDYNQDT